jgi:outer membrane protein OmpA-like peptidoglycan-associated protein
MSGIFLRWGVPALVTVVGGTSLAVSATSSDIAADLQSRTVLALEQGEATWARVDFEARDAIVRGTATDQKTIDEAVARVAAVHGVRSVRSEVVLAEFISPFPFSATIKNGEIALSGAVPDETAHAELALATGSANDTIRIHSGAPDRAQWDAAVAYGLTHLKEFDEGSFTLTDLEIAIDGRAKSPAAFDALSIMNSQPLPQGARLAVREITPALASPFEFHAEFNGSRIAVSGFTPTEAFAETLRTGGIGGWPVSSSLVLASGAPENFEANATALLQNLVLLEEGRADISDATATLAGAPADAETVDRIRAAMTPAGVALDLAPPRVEAYEFTATRTGNGIVLAGHVPDAATRERLDAIDGVSADALELARGAPERFDSAVDFALGLLGRMGSGSVTIRNTSIHVSGRAATIADFEAIEATLDGGAPQGLSVAAVEVKPPVATPFTWTAEKDADGDIRMSGFVPSRAARNALQQAAPGLDTDSSTIADGNPENFEAEALAALRILPFLKSATITYDGTTWSYRGAVNDPQEGFAAEQAFRAAGLREAGWTLVLDLPDAAAPVALPIIDPYVWRAQKGRDGRIALGGFVPTDALKRVLATRAGEGAVDTSALGAGHPENFVSGTLAGLDALMMLDEGSLTFDGRAWTLTGSVPTGADRLAVEGALQTSVDSAGWKLAIQAANAAPVVSPYAWSATKTADGSVSLSGYVATEEMKGFIAVRAGTVALDTTQVASGEPAGFAADVLAGLEALKHLNLGTIRFGDGTWSIAGEPQTAEDAELAIAALSTAATGTAWAAQLSDPVVRPVPEPAQPEVVALTPQPAATPEPAPVEPPAEIFATPEPVEPEQPAAEVAVSVPAATPSTEPLAADTAAAEIEAIIDSETPAATEPALEVAAAPEPVATPAPEPEPARVARDFAFLASKPLGGEIALQGVVPADAARRFFGVIAGGVPTESLALSPSLPETFIPNADAGIRLLASVDDGRFGLDRGAWVFEGRVENASERDAVLASIAATPGAAEWEANVTLLPPVEICRQHVAAFASRNEILFAAGSARMADESAPAIDELAGYLAECPETEVHVEGHTDADGADDLNLALSVARAEAVVEALIERGVSFQRLYAVGYGESVPIADNDTSAGKRANRRIAFSILDEQ